VITLHSQLTSANFDFLLETRRVKDSNEWDEMMAKDSNTREGLIPQDCERWEILPFYLL